MYKIKINDQVIETKDYEKVLELYGNNYKTANTLVVGDNNKVIMKKAKD